MNHYSYPRSYPPQLTISTIPMCHYLFVLHSLFMHLLSLVVFGFSFTKTQRKPAGTRKVNVRHLAQTLPSFHAIQPRPSPLHSRTHRPDLPFSLSCPPLPLSTMVEPRKSLVLAAGTGLFAIVDINKGDTVTWYGGNSCIGVNGTNTKHCIPHYAILVYQS